MGFLPLGRIFCFVNVVVRVGLCQIWKWLLMPGNYVRLFDHTNCDWSYHSTTMSIVGAFVASLQEHPINVVLLGIITYQASSLFRLSSSSSQSQGSIPTSYNESYNWKPEKHPKCTVWKRYTPKTLEPFSGRDGGQILLAIDRKIFDVTNGRNFYGPGEDIPQLVSNHFD